MFGGMFNNGLLSLIKPLTKMLGLVPELPDQPRGPGKPPGPDDAAVQAAA